MASYSWVGNADGSGNGSWDRGVDWSPVGVPGARDSVTFATGLPGYTVAGNDTVTAITVNTDVLTFDGSIGQRSGLTSTFLTATAGASVTFDQNASMTCGGGISFAVGTTLDDQGSMIIGGGSADLLIVEGFNGNLTTSSQLAVNQLYVQNGGSFTGDVALGDYGNITTDAGSSFGGGTLTVQGYGLFYDAAAAGQTTGTGSLADTIVLGGTGSSGLELGADPGVALAVSGPISGGGYVAITSGTIQLTGANTYTGGTVVQNATLELDANGTVGTGAIFLTDAAFVDNSVAQNAIGAVFTVVGGGTNDTVPSSDTVTAGLNSLLVYCGAAGTFNFIGGAAGSTVFGGTGTLLATAGSGSDLIFGGMSSADVLSAGTGHSTLVGGVNGGLLQDTNAGGNALVAYYGNTTITAAFSTGGDTMYGAAAGTTTFVGGAPGTVDTIVGGAGTSEVYGGTGTNDVFSGGGVLSLDFLTGYGGGTTDVVGFNVATDTIHLIGYSAADAFASEVVSGGNTSITLSDNTHIVLFGTTGVTLSNFT